MDQAKTIEDKAMSKEDKVNWDHTPIKNKKTKRTKVQDDHAKEDTVNAVLRAVQELTQKMDDQTQRFIHFEKQIKVNSLAIDKNKKDISEIQSQVALLKKENAILKSACDEHARYKRMWNLRLTGLPEKDDECPGDGHRDSDPGYPCVGGEAAGHLGHRAPAWKERERHHLKQRFQSCHHSVWNAHDSG